MVAAVTGAVVIGIVIATGRFSDAQIHSKSSLSMANEEFCMQRSARESFKSHRVCLAIFLFALLGFGPFLPCARADEGTMDVLAVKLAKHIRASKKHPKTVLVCDFLGPDAEHHGLTSLGTALADELSASLAHSGDPNLRVADRSQFLRVDHELGLERELATGWPMGQILAKHLGADEFISGELSRKGSDRISLAVELRETGKDEVDYSDEITIPLTPQIQPLIAEEVQDQPQSPYPLSGHHGYTTVKCQYCPYAPFDDWDVKKKVQGTVLLVMVVTKEGQTAEVRVLKGISSGLDDSAVTTVKKWQFKPATDPAGNPIAARQIVEIQFHLY